MAMPPECHALFLKTCQQLTEGLDGSGPPLPPFILIDPGLIPALIACVAFWDFINTLSNPQIRAECEVYASLKVLLPPYLPNTTEVGALEPAYDQVEYGTPKALKGVRRYLEKNWKPNPTLFDPANYILHRDGYYPGYFDMLLSPNLYVTKSLALLNSGSSSLDWRGESPASFTRTYMSNVPDYAGGILEMALYAVPCLQPIDIASVGMNCLFNPQAWKNNFEDFVYIYTLLRPDQLPQYLGCKMCWYRNVPYVLQPLFCLLPCRLNAAQLASREDFEGWLHRVFIRILAPPTTSMKIEYIILMPTTFRTFIQILVRAAEIGYPLEWISDFLGRILSDTLHSSWRPYPTTPIPADTINKRYASTKLQLSAWMADIEVVVASALPMLPQELASSLTRLDMTQTAVFRTAVNNVSSQRSYDRCPDLALVFCAPEFHPDQKTLSTYDLLISETATGNKVQIIYSILTWDMDVRTKMGNVSWRMSIARFEKMKQDGWVLYLWQANATGVASKSLKASEWKHL
ncbi:hypothetical protein DFH06DRAFT_1338952 [Mycena polygramma]|nr:hypothetical protein DFH06DRAFT_1338952 [Mycena polygramma]